MDIIILLAAMVVVGLVIGFVGRTDLEGEQANWCGWRLYSRNNIYHYSRSVRLVRHPRHGVQ